MYRNFFDLVYYYYSKSLKLISLVREKVIDSENLRINVGSYIFMRKMVAR